jgi:hypothetical protein
MSVAFALMLSAAFARAEAVEEEATVENGIVEECGDAPGLEKCRDADGETWKHADDPNYVKLDSTQQLENSSAEIRDESPKQLEQTIQQIEDDEKH